MHEKNPDELWKVIPDFPRYEMSFQGHIRNIKTGRLIRNNMVTLRRDNQSYCVNRIKLFDELFPR